MAAKDYILLTKPGIIGGNALTTVAGFFLGCAGRKVDIWLLFATLLGLSFVIASACICNNYIDREIDRQMARTRQRALAAETVSPFHAFALAALFGVLSFPFLLAAGWLAAGVAWSGFFLYVFAYSFLKHKTPHATLVGSIGGAVPPVVGYAAASQTLDLGALSIFSIVLLWQMPHFLAIALYRQKEYAKAGIPILPEARGVQRTKAEMAIYSALLLLALWTPTMLGLASSLYFAISSLLAAGWLAFAIRGFWIERNALWARQMFLYSLFLITAVCLLLCLPASGQVIVH